MMRRWRLAVAVPMAVIGAVPLSALPAAADMLVVQTTGGALAVGQTVASGALLNLPAGASVTLVSQDGHVVTLTGPYSGKPEENDARSGNTASGVSALSRMLAPKKTDTNSLGVIRGTLPQTGNQTPARDAAKENVSRK